MLLDFSSKVNAIILAFAAEFSLLIRLTSIVAQKIDRSAVKTYEIVIAGFSIQDTSPKIRFFEKTFWLVNGTSDVSLEISFLAFSHETFGSILKDLLREF